MAQTGVGGEIERWKRRVNQRFEKWKSQTKKVGNFASSVMCHNLARESRHVWGSSGFSLILTMTTFK